MLNLSDVNESRKSQSRSSVVKTAERKTTFASSNMKYRDRITDTAIIDCAIALFIADSAQSVIVEEMIAELISVHFNRSISAKRIQEHIGDNIAKDVDFYKLNVKLSDVCTKCNKTKCKHTADKMSLYVVSDMLLAQADNFVDLFFCCLEQDTFKTARTTI